MLSQYACQICLNDAKTSLACFLQLVEEASIRYKRPAPTLPGAVLSRISAREWPGNVRELRNAADRFALGLDLDIGGAKAGEGRTPFGSVGDL